jgi:hypothetical protein
MIRVPPNKPDDTIVPNHAFSRGNRPGLANFHISIVSQGKTVQIARRPTAVHFVSSHEYGLYIVKLPAPSPKGIIANQVANISSTKKAQITAAIRKPKITLWILLDASPKCEIRCS